MKNDTAFTVLESHLHFTCICFNITALSFWPFMHSGLFHPYQTEEFICQSGGILFYFSLLFTVSVWSSLNVLACLSEYEGKFRYF